MTVRAWGLELGLTALAVVLPLALAAPRLGDVAADFTIYSPTLRKTVQLSSLKGQPVVLNFWGSWCAPCREEMPALNAVAGRLKGKLNLLAIIVGEPSTKSLQFLADQKLEGLTVLGGSDLADKSPDTGDSVADTYGVNSYPTSVFIDRNGVVQAVKVGPMTERSFLSYLRNIDVTP